MRTRRGVTAPPTVRQVVEYTNGQTMPTVRFAMFRTGMRGRPVDGYSPRVFASLKDIENFLSTGKLSAFCPTGKRKPTIEIKFVGDSHRFWARLVRVEDKVALVIPEFGTLLMVKARDKQAWELLSTMEDLPPNLYTPAAVPVSLPPPPPPAKEFWPRPWARVLMFGLREVNVRIMTELDHVPAPATPLPATLRQHFLSQVVVEIAKLKLSSHRPHLAMLIAINMAESADRATAKKKGEATRIAMAAVEQADAWATNSSKLTEEAMAILASVEKEL